LATRAIFGLGNPGPRYAATRHNVGFMVVERLARRHGVELASRDPLARWGDVRIGESAVRLVEPLRFMNRSGEALALLPGDAPLGGDDLLVVHDELDLPFGRLKLKRGGGTAGHRGLESIVEHLGDPGFCRLRVGIGRPPEGADVADFVLTPFPDAEAERLGELLDRAADACEAWLALGIGPAMNRVNARPAPEAAGEPPGPDASEGSGTP
jgi:PTH1 family peptidyl-tRNA hydrolase